MTPVNVPICKIRSKKMGTSRPIASWRIAKCPELEIGNHSVKPCTMPRIIACNTSIMSGQPNDISILCVSACPLRNTNIGLSQVMCYEADKRPPTCSIKVICIMKMW
jgi:hypothetical protein